MCFGDMNSESNQNTCITRSVRPFFPGPLPVFGDRRRCRVGILGGSFNPAHEGHRYISLQALRRLRLDEVWWLVSPQNPLKGEVPDDLHLRAEGARRVSRHPRIRISTIESGLPTRFTAQTLKVLKRRFPCIRFIWLMGADNLIQIPRWFQWREIFQQVPVAVLDRGDYAGMALSGKAACVFAAYQVPEGRAPKIVERAPPTWAFLRIRCHAASSTALRARR